MSAAFRVRHISMDGRSRIHLHFKRHSFISICESRPSVCWLFIWQIDESNPGAQNNEPNLTNVELRSWMRARSRHKTLDLAGAV
jgi:hypothetical protein